MGPPGVGKGTQAKILSKTLNVTHLSTGEILRHEIKMNTKIGKIAKSFIDHGNFVPDKLVLDIISEKISIKISNEGYLFDGFPRTIPQAVALSEICEVSHVIAIEVPDERIVERICGRYTCVSCGSVYHDTFKPTQSVGQCDNCESTDFSRRADDNEDTVNSRMSAYHEQTSPLANWYDEKGIFHRIDGDRGIDEITSDILNALR